MKVLAHERLAAPLSWAPQWAVLVTRAGPACEGDTPSSNTFMSKGHLSGQFLWPGGDHAPAPRCAQAWMKLEVQLDAWLVPVSRDDCPLSLGVAQEG